MACLFPKPASKLADGSVRLGEVVGAYQRLEVPCTECEGCLRRRALDMKVRLYCEALANPPAICVCFTYDDANLPMFGSLSAQDWVLVMKRVREYASRVDGVSGIKAHCIGEYSPAPALRPHLHASLFGWRPQDAEPFNTSHGGNPQFVSETLTRLWGKGLVTFQDYTTGAADYVAGHEGSKKRAFQPVYLDPHTGAVIRLEPEFESVSRGRGGGLGAKFYELYGDQIRGQDFIVLNGSQYPVPRYFDAKSKDVDPARLERAKAKRMEKAKAQAENSTLLRLPGRLDYEREMRKRRAQLRKLSR